MTTPVAEAAAEETKVAATAATGSSSSSSSSSSRPVYADSSILSYQDVVDAEARFLNKCLADADAQTDEEIHGEDKDGSRAIWHATKQCVVKLMDAKNIQNRRSRRVYVCGLHVYVVACGTAMRFGLVSLSPSEALDEHIRALRLTSTYMFIANERRFPSSRYVEVPSPHCVCYKPFPHRICFTCWARYKGDRV